MRGRLFPPGRALPGRGWIPRRADVRALVRLAAPVVTIQVGLMLMGVVDTIMVGHVSPQDLAAVAMGNLYFFLVAVFGMGVLMALDPLVAQAVGAGDHPAVGRSLQRGILLSLVLGLVAAALLLLAGPVLTLLRQPPEVVPIAAGYAFATMAGTTPFFLFVAFRQTLQAMARLGPIVVTIVVANVLNLSLNWVLVYGNLGAPAMGAVGSGWASSGSRILMALMLPALAWPILKPHLRPFRREVLEWRPMLRMVRLGAPIGMQFQLEFGAFGAVGILMGWMGTVPMAGHQVAINLASLTFMVPMGVSAAASVLVGHAVGRQDPVGARRGSAGALLLGTAFMTFTAALFILFPGPLAELYTGDAGVLAVAMTLLPIAGFFQIVDGLQAVAGGILRGLGDTRTPMLANILGFWVAGIPLGVVLAFPRAGGPAGLWWGLSLGLALVAGLLLWRVRVGMRRPLERVVLEGA